MIRTPAENPFERYDLDPREGVQGITERLRELSLDANDEATRSEVRAAWEELTLHPARRIRAALLAHPDTRAPLGPPPPRPSPEPPPPLALADVAPRPEVARVLSPASSAESVTALVAPPPPLPLDEDPVLRAPGGGQGSGQ